MYRTPRWHRLRRDIIGAWVREHGWTCPGWRRPAHPVQRLTLDHVRPLIQGGDPYARSNLSPLCASCQARKSLSQR